MNKIMAVIVSLIMGVLISINAYADFNSPTIADSNSGDTSAKTLSTDTTNTPAVAQDPELSAPGSTTANIEPSLSPSKEDESTPEDEPLEPAGNDEGDADKTLSPENSKI